MDDEVDDVLTCSSSVIDDDDDNPIIFVCNGEVNTSCLDDLHKDSLLKKGVLHALCKEEEEEQQQQNVSTSTTTSQRYGGGRPCYGFLQQNRNQIIHNSNGFDDMDSDGNSSSNMHRYGEEISMDLDDEATEGNNLDSSFLWRILYGFKFPVDTALTEHGESLFMMTSQWITYIATISERQTGTLLGQLNLLERKELLRRRKQIKLFLNFVNQQVKTSNNNSSSLSYYYKNTTTVSDSRCNSSSWGNIEEKDDKYAVFLKELLVNVQSLLLDVGILSDLPIHCVQSGVSRLGNNSTNRRYHLFHLHFDIYWSMLELVFLVLDKCPKLDTSSNELIRDLQWLSPSSVSLTRTSSEQQPVEQDFFQFLVELYVRDMTNMAWHRFSSLGNSDLNKVSPFPCTCVKEMWIMLIQVLRYRQRSRGGRSFWFTLYQVLNDMLDGSPTKDAQDGSTQDPQISFRFWMIFSLAPLYQFDNVGKISTETKYVDGNYDEIVSLVKKLVSNNRPVNEEELRYYLQGCLQVCRLWKPDLTLVSVLWNYFFRKLNSPFKVTTLTVTGLQTLRHTASGLFEDCCNWQNPNQSSLSKESSFHLFLRLVCSMLQETMKDERHGSWRNFRGRLLSKFHQRGMQELTESGLTYFTELFLTLALCTRDNQLLEQLCNFYDMIDFSVTDPKRQGVILRGISAAMLICVKWDRDVEFLAERITPLVASVARKFVSLETEGNKRQKMWDLVAAYVEDLQDLVEHSQSLGLSEHKLVTKELCSILPISRNYEMRRVLSLFNTIMNKLLMLIKKQRDDEGDIYIPNDHHEQMAQILWVNIFPFIETHAKTQTPLPEVGDLATQFFILSIVFPDWSPASSVVLLKFTCDSLVNIKVTIRFLGHILDDPLTRENILDDPDKPFKDSIQLKLIQCWIKCWLLLGSVSAFLEPLHSITQHVLCFPNVSRISGPLTDISDAMVELFKKFSKLHNEAKEWKTKIDLREEAKLYFNEVNRCLQLVLKTPSDQDQLYHIYNVVGHLVKNCAPLLFNSQCLPEIIDSLIFPHSLFVPTKPLNRLVQSAVQKTFHLFVSGLSKINSKQNPYVQRRLRDLVLQYLPRFPLSQSTHQDIDISLSLTKSHPLVTVLTDLSLRSTIQDFTSFRHFVLVTIKDNLFKVENLRFSETSLLVFNFVAKLIEKTTEADDLCMDTVVFFQPLLEGYLLSKTSQLKQCTILALSKLLKACSQHPEVSPKEKLLETLHKFQQGYFPFFSTNMFPLCERLACFYPVLLSENAMALTRVFFEFERKSGSGLNANLRQQWSNYVHKLGKTEELEKTLET